jgi:hypothetical protein
LTILRSAHALLGNDGGTHTGKVTKSFRLPIQLSVFQQILWSLVATELLQATLDR